MKQQLISLVLVIVLLIYIYTNIQQNTYYILEKVVSHFRLYAGHYCLAKQFRRFKVMAPCTLPIFFRRPSLVLAGVEIHRCLPCPISISRAISKTLRQAVRNWKYMPPTQKWQKSHAAVRVIEVRGDGKTPSR